MCNALCLVFLCLFSFNAIDWLTVAYCSGNVAKEKTTTKNKILTMHFKCILFLYECVWFFYLFVQKGWMQQRASTVSNFKRTETTLNVHQHFTSFFNIFDTNAKWMQQHWILQMLLSPNALLIFFYWLKNRLELNSFALKIDAHICLNFPPFHFIHCFFFPGIFRFLFLFVGLIV